MAAAFSNYIKDETFDPGVNLDSCGEDSEPETLNNEKVHSHSQSDHDLSSVQNDLTCKCSGTKCICADPTGESGFTGGPNADPGPKPKGCQGGNLRDGDKHKCRGAQAKHLYPKDGETTKGIWTCQLDHKNLCKYCFRYSRCPVCGPQVKRNEGK